jgi:hypothetical protein
MHHAGKATSDVGEVQASARAGMVGEQEDAALER